MHMQITFEELNSVSQALDDTRSRRVLVPPITEKMVETVEDYFEDQVARWSLVPTIQEPEGGIPVRLDMLAVAINVALASYPSVMEIVQMPEDTANRAGRKKEYIETYEIVVDLARRVRG